MTKAELEEINKVIDLSWEAEMRQTKFGLKSAIADMRRRLQLVIQQEAEKS